MGLNEACADGEGRRTRGKAGRVCGRSAGCRRGELREGKRATAVGRCGKRWRSARRRGRVLRLGSMCGMGLNEACAKGERRGARLKAGRVCGEMLGGWRLQTGRSTGGRTGRDGAAGQRRRGRPRPAAGRRGLGGMGMKRSCADREGRRTAWRVGSVCGEMLGRGGAGQIRLWWRASVEVRFC